jgi:hypothetical protein
MPDQVFFVMFMGRGTREKGKKKRSAPFALIRVVGWFVCGCVCVCFSDPRKITINRKQQQQQNNNNSNHNNNKRNEASNTLLFVIYDHATRDDEGRVQGAFAVFHFFYSPLATFTTRHTGIKRRGVKGVDSRALLEWRGVRGRMTFTFLSVLCTCMLTTFLFSVLSLRQEGH